MPDLIDALVSYSEESRIPCYLRTPEYRQAVNDLEALWERFRSLLTAEQTRDLDNILEQESDVRYLEDRAAFQAALSIGLDLGRVYRGAAHS